MYRKKIFKKRTVTKLLAMLLTVICVAQLIPVDAYAQDEENKKEVIYVGDCYSVYSDGTVNLIDDCEKIESITFPDTLTGIKLDKYTFVDCENLKEITINSRGTTIGYRTFTGIFTGDLDLIESITINDPDVIIEPEAFTASKVKNVTFPEGLTVIPDYCFYACHDLASFTIPNTVKRVGEGAFYCCSALTSITIPKNVTSIGDYAFYGCTSLKTVTFKKNTSTSKKLSIGSSAFEYCEKLASITIPRNIKVIKNDVFDHCDKLKKIIIKGNVDTIRSEAFTGIFGLERIIITGNVGKAGYIYSNGLGNPKKVEIRGTLGSGLKKIQADKIIVNGKVYKWNNDAYEKLIYVGKA